MPVTPPSLPSELVETTPVPIDFDGSLERFFEDFDSVLALEDQIAPFNLFEAVGMQRAEIRHSHFLAYILDPSRRHGLGEEFLKRFLYRALVDIKSTDPLPAEIMIAELGEAVIEREREYIDVLITLESSKLVIAIENKIDAGETGDQLVRYHDWVCREYPDDWRKVFLFLSPTAAPPSDDRWRSIGYMTVVRALSWLLESSGRTTSSDVDLALRHYRDMMERHILDADRNREIARRIYRKHKEVFDFIYASLPNLIDATVESCLEVVTSRPDVVPIRHRIFRSRAWGEQPPLRDLMRESESFLYFELTISSDVRLWLYLGNGPEAARAKIFDAVQKAGSPFAPRNEMTSSYTYLLREILVSKDECAELPPDECGKLAGERLGEFLNTSLSGIDAILSAAV